MPRRAEISNSRSKDGLERCINTEYRMQGTGSTRRRGMVQCTLSRGHEGECEQRGLKFAEENGQGISLAQTRKLQRQRAAARRLEKGA